ncbi:MAG TPA: peptidoglycan DD-metalloendopeptidase family protein [Methylophilaceae bacterium]
MSLFKTGFCLSLLVWGLTLQAAPAKNAPPKDAPSKESLKDLQERIESLKQELDHNEGAHDEAADALKQSEQAISEANLKLLELRQQQKANVSTLNDLNQKQSVLQNTIAEQQRLLGEQLYRQRLAGEQGYLRILLEQKDPNTVERNLQYFRYIASARSKMIAALRKNLGHVAELNDKTEATLKEVAQLKSQQESAKQDLQKEKAEHKNVMQQLAAKIQSQRGEISKLQRDEKRLSDLLERLARIVPKTPKKSKKKSDNNVSTPSAEPESTQHNDAIPDETQDSGVFAALRGKLRLPTKGDVTNKFGAARAETGISWKGLFIKASEGNEVHSIASGRVVFADWLRGFGNLLIVDHGDGYMSLYGNNQALLKRVGDEVKPGDTVASVGNSGGNPESGVYFELRHKSVPLDPLAWCVVK